MVLEQKDLPIVDMEFMNDVHNEDIEIINDLFECILNYENNSTNENKDILNNKYTSWYNHTVEHFKGEEIMMQEKGFPPYIVHKSEHDRALALMQEKFNLWNESNDINVLKSYIIEEVPTWFKAHISTMDTMTARFFKTGAMMCHV